MFGVIVGDVDVAGCPEDVELVLFDAVAYPVETHVHCTAAALFDSVIGNAIGAGVVGLYWCRWLWVSHGS